MKQRLVILFLFLYLISCSSKGSFLDEKLTLSKQDYHGTELKTNGYYFRKDYGQAVFLFRNGVALTTLFPDTSNHLQLFESSILDGSLSNNLKSTKDAWGVFTVNTNQINKEGFYSGENLRYITYIHSGIIINDTTFVFTSDKRSHRRRREPVLINDTFLFRPFSHKPDSTNEFIK